MTFGIDADNQAGPMTVPGKTSTRHAVDEILDSFRQRLGASAGADS